MRRGTLSIACALAFGGCLAAAQPASAQTTVENFTYTGGAQTWTVPAGVTSATFDMSGGSSIIFVSGDDPDDLFGGLAGRVRATIPVTPGDSIQVNVGGQGDNSGGWNGGGDGAGFGGGGSGGGGATDIRIGGTTLSDRVLVAAGGGGIGFCSTDAVPILDGGDGGGNGADGVSGGCGGTGGGGATVAAGGTPNGSFGSGGNAAVGTTATGGGGGGYYGGGGGLDGGAGGGGSSFGPTGTTFEDGVLTVNGSATISYPTPSGPPTNPGTSISAAGAVPAAEAELGNCKRLREKLKRQKKRLAKAGTAKKRARFAGGIKRTKRALRALGC